MLLLDQTKIAFMVMTELALASDVSSSLISWGVALSFGPWWWVGEEDRGERACQASTPCDSLCQALC